MPRSPSRVAPLDASAWRARWLDRTTLTAGLLAVAVYLGSLANGFVLDDDPLIVTNPVVRGDGGLARILASHYWAGEARRSDLYRPLTIATYWINFRIGGVAPWSYHLVNLLLHAAVTVLAVRLFRRLAASEGTAAVAALLFAVHPVHAEAVAGVVGRADLLAALFVLSAWLLRDRPWVAVPLFVCGLLSKESAVALPALMLIEDTVVGRKVERVRPWWRAPLAYVPFLLAIATVLVLRFLVLGRAAMPSGGPFVATSTWHRILTAVAVIGRYLWVMIWPAHLSADYSFKQIPLSTSPLDAGFLMAAAAVALLAALAWLSRNRIPAIPCGLLFFFAALAPVSNIPFGIGVVMAERLLYLPSAGLCLAAGAVVEAIGTTLRAKWRQAATVVMLVPFALLAGRTIARTRDWHDSLTLFEATAGASPRSALAHFGLAVACHNAGRIEQAEAEYRLALAIDPGSVRALIGYATLLESVGRRQEAIAAAQEAVRLDPEEPETHENLGILYADAGRLEEAESEYRRAILLDPERAVPHTNLGMLLETLGRMPESLAEHRESARLAPYDARVLNNLGRALVAMGRPQEAIETLARAVALGPDDPVPEVNLAAAWLATGDAGRAIAITETVLREHPGNAAARRVRDAALRRQGGAGAPP